MRDRALSGFVGPHVVDAARARGHTVTLFNRGKTHPKLFPDIEKLRGDRDGKLDALQDREWDAVVDTSGYVPRIVKQSVELLAPSVGHYVFVSTMSVYANEDKVDADETAEVQTLDAAATEDVSKAYGPLKAACEAVCDATMPGRVTNLRTGWMVGPLDPTGRFTYWPSRLADGGEVLAPGDGSTPVQLIDARDMAAFIITTIENTTVGTFNAFGPSNHPKIQLTIAPVRNCRYRQGRRRVNAASLSRAASACAMPDCHPHWRASPTHGSNCAVRCLAWHASTPTRFASNESRSCRASRSSKPAS